MLREPFTEPAEDLRGRGEHLAALDRDLLLLDGVGLARCGVVELLALREEILAEPGDRLRHQFVVWVAVRKLHILFAGLVDLAEFLEHERLLVLALGRVFAVGIARHDVAEPRHGVDGVLPSDLLVG